MAPFRALATIPEEDETESDVTERLQEPASCDKRQYADKQLIGFGIKSNTVEKNNSGRKNLESEKHVNKIPPQNGVLEMTEIRRQNVETQAKAKPCFSGNGLNNSNLSNCAQFIPTRQRSDIEIEQALEYVPRRTKIQKQPWNNPSREHWESKQFSQTEDNLLNERQPPTQLTNRRQVLYTAPRRGTVAFMKYAAEREGRFPSYWSINAAERSWQSCANGSSINNGWFLRDVDFETWNTISKLVTATLDFDLVGLGSDAKGINYNRYVDIKRVENPQLFEPYREKRKRLLKRMIRSRHICPDIGRIPGSKGRVVTSQLLSNTLRSDLYYEVNESYLFHGTKSDRVDSIIQYGLDPKFTSESAMFGKGVYAAERATKADQYTDPVSQRTPNGTNLTLILTRMLLGNVFLCDDIHESLRDRNCKKLIRPPCRICLEDVCLCGHRNHFDSVMGDGEWLFREFVVYEKDQCYPEYVITYQRI